MLTDRHHRSLKWLKEEIKIWRIHTFEAKLKTLANE